MLRNYVKSMLSSVEEFELTDSQKLLVEDLADYIVSDEQDVIFILRGYAGTGKTVMINQLTKTLESLKISFILMAPTGRAAKVLINYTGTAAYTIHKKIYRQKSSSDGMGMFVLDKNMHRNCWFIVDESSMISDETGENSVFGTGRLLNDLIEYVYSGAGCRLVLVGDTAQLPPVGIPVSPALDKSTLERYGFGVIDRELREVVRQDLKSGILANATMIRERISAEELNEGFFPLKMNGYADVERIQGNELLEKISFCYEMYGNQETTILTRSNKRANLYNKGIRSSILFRDTELSRGDLLMVVKNNYFWFNEDVNVDFIANGDIAEITHIYGYEELYGFRFANASLLFPDYDHAETECKILLNTLWSETASLSRDDQVKLFNAVSEDYQEIKNKRDRWARIKKDPYYNALQVKFAYAVTCHKSQGGQWKAVFIDTGFITEEMVNREFLRWLYTAFTRSAEKLYLVNFDKRFFE